MKALIGDIGNTITKICLIEVSTLKTKKKIYLKSSNIPSIRFLKKNLKCCSKISIYIEQIFKKKLQN